jgi:hypothetical protein
VHDGIARQPSKDTIDKFHEYLQLIWCWKQGRKKIYKKFEKKRALSGKLL